MDRPENKKIVMFDFDGVLIDTLIPCYTINTQANEDLDIEEYKSFFDGNIHNSVRKDGEPRKYDPNFAELYNSYTRELKIPEILKDSVKNLSTSYILVIISSTISDSIRQILIREGINECFSDLLGSDIDKSKIIKIKMILDKYNVNPNDCVFITDTLGDIREADHYNIPSIAVTWGFHSRENLEKGHPVAIIDDPSTLTSEIENVLK